MGNNTGDVQISDNMQQLRQRYIERLQGQLREFNRTLELCEKREVNDIDKQTMRGQAHKLAGTGKTYGFFEISKNAKALEEALLENPQLAAEEIAPLLGQLIAACKTAEAASITPSPQPAKTVMEEALQVKRANLPLVLTIDDDENVTSFIAALFKDKARIVSAGNADEGARLMKQLKPDIVLLDDMMPGGVSGLRMLEAINNDQELAKIPVIMLTTSDRPQDVMRGYVAGAIDYVTKPFDPAELSRKVEEHLSRQSATILVADDDANVTDLLSYKLQAMGYKVVVCENGIRALLAMEKAVPALAILDRMMPGMDGVALLQKMRQDPALKNVPVLFLTARRQEADIIEGLKLGASDYIPKPFNPDEVVVRMERFIKRA